MKKNKQQAQEWAEQQLNSEEGLDELHHQMLRDEVTYGMSGFIISENGITRPATIEEILNCKSFTTIEKLSVSQIMEKYKDVLSKEDFKKLKEYETRTQKDS